MSSSKLQAKESKLVNQLSNLDRLLVAYSGGVDSSVLAYYACKVLGAKAKLVIAISPSLAADELEAARNQARQFGWHLLEIVTDEVSKPEYQRNDTMRCYFCKSALFEEIEKIAEQQGVQYLAYGAIYDDLSDFRPGAKAAHEHKVLTPLQAAELTKDDVRLLARQAGLPSWDRPQAACLASRFQTYEPISVELLGQVEKAEHYLHTLGFKQVRVRHHRDLARLEFGVDELPRLTADVQLLKQIACELKKLGYTYVVLDMEGYRQGSANQIKADEKKQVWTAIS